MYAEYIKLLAEQKKSGKKGDDKTTTQVPPVQPKPVVVVPTYIVGKRIKHKSYGEGTITGISGAIIVVSFDSVDEKKLGYEACIKNKLIRLLE